MWKSSLDTRGARDLGLKWEPPGGSVRRGAGALLDLRGKCR